MTIVNIKAVKIEEEMRSSYLDYAMSVIVSRAQFDVGPAQPVERVHVVRETLQDALVSLRRLAPAPFYGKRDSLLGSLADKSGLFFFIVYHFFAPNQNFPADPATILP